MSTISVSVSDELRNTYPAAYAGFMLVSCEKNIHRSEKMQQQKGKLVQVLRERFPDKNAIKNDATIQIYQRYYQQFKSNFHVRFQIETMTIKGKDMPTRSVLVDALFMTELKYGLLIAGHDMDNVQMPITVDCTQMFEMFTQLGGTVKTLKDGDMCFRDAEKTLSCILYGPEDSSPVTMDTKKVLYTIYGPQGISREMVSEGLDDIAANAQLAIPDLTILDKCVVGGKTS
ncbi:MAG: hypothetical protein JEZ00_06645 [Anaerolineaceae bacterium]|nr:hypothetical protein [Anaerolineaceae bacterium]